MREEVFVQHVTKSSFFKRWLLYLQDTQLSIRVKDSSHKQHKASISLPWSVTKCKNFTENMIKKWFSKFTSSKLLCSFYSTIPGERTDFFLEIPQLRDAKHITFRYMMQGNSFTSTCRDPMVHSVHTLYGVPATCWLLHLKDNLSINFQLDDVI